MEVIIAGKKYVEEQKENKNNTGADNSGNRNSGDWNSGYCNSGNWNSGDRNSGNCNSGNCNSEYCNSGCWNSGNRNSGYRNSGDWNSGHWNSGYRNSGNLNTTEAPLRIFNKETKVKREDIKYPNYFYFDLNVWVEVKDMSDKEKEDFGWYKTTNGYLKKMEYKEAWKQSFDKTTKEDVALTLKLPNFDYKLFEEISGITKEDFDKKLK